MRFSSSQKYIVLLGAPLLILVFHHFFCYFGHYGIDDMWYAKLATQWSNGNINMISQDHYEHRWALVGLTSIIYKIFGINDFASGLFPMLFAILTCYLITKVRDNDFLVSFLAILIFVTNEWTLFYSDKLMPDTHVAFYFFCSMSVYARSLITNNKNRLRLQGILAAFLLFLGLLSKGTIILTVPVFAYFILYDLIKKRNRVFWINFLIAGCILCLGYFSFFALNGDALIRLSSIRNNSYFNNCSYDQLPTLNLIKRVGYEFWLELTKNGFTALVAFIFYSFYKGKKVNVWDSVLIVGLLGSNFMSTSINDYVPMCPEWRHFLFLVPIGAVSGAKAIVYLIEGKRLNYSLLIVFLGLAIFAYLMGYISAFKTVYLPLFLMLGFLKIYNKPVSRKLLLVLIILISSLTVLKLFNHSKTSKYQHQLMVFNEIVKPYMYNDSSPILISNHVQLNFCSYYLRFDQKFTKTFQRYGDHIEADFDGEIIIFINGYTRYLSGKQYQDLPKIVKLYYEHGSVEGTFKLYENEEITILKMKASPELLTQLSP